VHYLSSYKNKFYNLLICMINYNIDLLLPYDNNEIVL
jgi:hypothetical protein